MRVWIGVPSRVSQMMKVLLAPIPAKNLSSLENANFYTHYYIPFKTATGLRVSVFHRMTGASGVF